MTEAAVASATAPLWYTTRATGVIALILLTAAVVLGIVVRVRFATDRWPRLVTMGVHRNVSLLVLVFLALHIATAVLDPYAPVGLPSILVPFASAYRPLWLGLGTAAFDLLLAITLTSLWRARIGVRAWRLVHWLSYACWPVAVLHGLGTGSDARQPVVLGVTVLCVACVALAGAWRLADGWPSRRTSRLAAGALAVAVIAAAGAWTVSGPLKPGWAARAGTPSALVAAAAAANGSTAGTLPSPPFTAAITGTVTTTASGNQATVVISGTGSGAAAVRFAITISGPQARGGGVQMTGSHVTFGPESGPTAYTGQVTALDGGSIQAAVTGPGGPALTLTLDLAVEDSAVTGTLSATSGSR